MHRVFALGLAGLALSACSLHVARHGISGNIMGHSFSGAQGALPAGFPSHVPVPDSSRVLAGGGTGNTWDVAFAVTGPMASGTTAYESKLRAAGYMVSNVRSGSTPVTGATNAGANSTSTTVTVTGTEFTAVDASGTVQVVAGTASSSPHSGLRSGEFAINITVVPPPSNTTPTT